LITSHLVLPCRDYLLLQQFLFGVNQARSLACRIAPCDRSIAGLMTDFGDAAAHFYRSCPRYRIAPPAVSMPVLQWFLLPI
jgi:hypothetical protein